MDPDTCADNGPTRALRGVLAVAVIGALLLTSGMLAWRIVPVYQATRACERALEAGQPAEAMQLYLRAARWRGRDDPGLLERVAVAVLLEDLRRPHDRGFMRSAPCHGLLGGVCELREPGADAKALLREMATRDADDYDGIDTFEVLGALARGGEVGAREELIARVEDGESLPFPSPVVDGLLATGKAGRLLLWARDAHATDPSLTAIQVLAGLADQPSDIDLVCERSEGAFVQAEALVRIARRPWAREHVLARLRALHVASERDDDDGSGAPGLHAWRREAERFVLATALARLGDAEAKDDLLAVIERPPPRMDDGSMALISDLRAARALFLSGAPEGLRLLAAEVAQPPEDDLRDHERSLWWSCAAHYLTEAPTPRGDLVAPAVREVIARDTPLQPHWLLWLGRVGELSDLPSLWRYAEADDSFPAVVSNRESHGEAYRVAAAVAALMIIDRDRAAGEAG